MTPTARRMASELGSACCHGEADRLLNVVAGVNFGTKRVERTTRLVGDDLERWRTEWLSGSITVVGGAPVRRPLREGRILCVGLDGTGVPALPSETAGRKGKDGRATTREAKVGAVWVAEPDGEGGTRPAPGSTRHFAAVESAEDDAKGDSPAWRWGTARTGFGGCTGRGSRTRSASWTSSTPRSTCGRRRGAATGTTRRPRSGGRRSCAGCSRRGGWTTCWRRCGAPAREPGTRQGGPLPVRVARPDALRRVPLARPADRIGVRRGGLQDGGGAAHEMHRHALDGGRHQPRALGALRPARRLVRRLLGTPPQAGCVRRWRPLTQNLSHTLGDAAA